jgi:hypothetical protein
MLTKFKSEYSGICELFIKVSFNKRTRSDMCSKNQRISNQLERAFNNNNNNKKDVYLHAYIIC